ncbi:CHASE domain-containing protein [Candidatus Woesebacteria bacterium]|nr:CHASE domain-containing protein [Candidatus Woesebacteria bacterium]
MKKMRATFDRHCFVIVSTIAILTIEIILATILIRGSVYRLQTMAQERLEADADRFFTRTGEQFNAGRNTLRALHGLYAGSRFVGRAEFSNFLEISQFFESYPGFTAVAYVPQVTADKLTEFEESVRTDTSLRSEGYPNFQVTPAGKREVYWPVTYIAPEAENESLLGVDQASEEFRAKNIAQARDTGDIAVSNILQLQQGGTGIIVVEPLYASPNIPSTVEERREKFLGTVATSIQSNQFFQPIFEQTNIHTHNIDIFALTNSDVRVDILRKSDTLTVFDVLYGTVTTERIGRPTDGVLYNFLFSAPASTFLSQDEKLEPFILFGFFTFAGIGTVAAILISQRMKFLADYRERYTFIRTLSHQLRTPLTKLNWSLELQDAQKGSDISNDARGSIHTLNSLVQHMIAYLDTQTEKNNRINRKNISIAKLYQAALARIPSNINTERVTLASPLPKKTIHVPADKLALSLSDIIENALLYSDESAPVVIDFAVKKNALVVTISDSGIGIPSKEHYRVFDEFFRGSNASLKKKCW